MSEKETAGTPRVDEVAEMLPDAEVIAGRLVYMGQATECVSAEFARQLEREVAALTTQLAEKDKEMVRRLADLLCTVPTGAPFQSVLKRAEAAEAQRDELQKRMGYTAVPVAEGGANIDQRLTLDTDDRVFFYEQDFYVLSNFSSFMVKWRGWLFPTSEHAYHWAKFRNHDLTGCHCEMILASISAHEAFKYAERYKADRRPDWDAVKVPIMREILQAKVEQHEYVRRKLLATGERTLIENSWRDDYWGWGPNRDGKNMLGKLWMEIRASLATGTAQATECPTNGTEGLRAELDAPAKHWHDLYQKQCLLRQDDAARYGQQIQDAEARIKDQVDAYVELEERTHKAESALALAAEDAAGLEELIRSTKAELDAAKRALAEQWVDVNDGLPEIGQHVLVSYFIWADKSKDRAYTVGHRDQFNSWFHAVPNPEYDNLYPPTHWMPIAALAAKSPLG